MGREGGRSKEGGILEGEKGWRVERGNVFIVRKIIPGSMKRLSSLKI